MLMLSSRLKDSSVMSLQTGGCIAQVTKAIINPATLDIVAYRLSGKGLESEDLLLLTRDIREIGNLGLIVDSADELVATSDMIKLKDIIKLGFNLLNMPVIDDDKNKLGRIYDYTIDPMDFKIHQIYVKRPLIRSLQTSDLIINKSQIIEVNNTHIIVNSASLDEKAKPASIAEGFVNPFRKPSAPPAGSNTIKNG